VRGLSDRSTERLSLNVFDDLDGVVDVVNIALDHGGVRFPACATKRRAKRVGVPVAAGRRTQVR